MLETEPSDLEMLLFLSLRATPCRCEYERIANVPTWHKGTGGELERKLVKRCSRCVAVYNFEKIWGPQS
jgi:hypothetical protein